MVIRVAQVLISIGNGYKNVPQMMFFDIEHPFVQIMRQKSGSSFGSLYNVYGEDYMEKVQKESLSTIPISNTTVIPPEYSIVEVFMFRE